MEHPQPYSDTDPRAMAVWLDLLRKMPPGDRLASVLEFSDLVFHLSETGMRIRYPEASDREIFLRAAASHIDRDLMIRAYGWDPAEHEESSRRV